MLELLSHGMLAPAAHGAEGSADEIILLVVGLGIALAVILTGRRDSSGRKGRGGKS